MSKIQAHMLFESIASGMRRPLSQSQDFSDALTVKHDKTALPIHLGDMNPGGSSRKPDNGAPPPASNMPQSKSMSASADMAAEAAGCPDLSNLETAQELVTSRLFSEIPDALLGLPIGSTDQAVAWSRVFGQHLIANDYLSVVEVVGRDQSENNVLPWPYGSHKAVPMFDGGSSTGSPVVGQAREAGPQTNVLSVARLSMEGEPDPGNARIGPDVSLMGLENTLALDRLWAKRVLKLARDPAGGCTAWIRDFGLCESEVQTLAASLKRYASIQGVPLNRIVINGHEIWRSLC